VRNSVPVTELGGLEQGNPPTVQEVLGSISGGVHCIFQMLESFFDYIIIILLYSIITLIAVIFVVFQISKFYITFSTKTGSDQIHNYKPPQWPAQCIAESSHKMSLFSVNDNGT
jgi:hypothetical protein